jgi:hypothetical protein
MDGIFACSIGKNGKKKKAEFALPTCAYTDGLNEEYQAACAASPPQLAAVYPLPAFFDFFASRAI